MGTKIMHRKTNIDVDEDSIIHPMVCVAPNSTPNLSPTYTINMPMPTLRTITILSYHYVIWGNQHTHDHSSLENINTLEMLLGGDLQNVNECYSHN